MSSMGPGMIPDTDCLLAVTQSFLHNIKAPIIGVVARTSGLEHMVARVRCALLSTHGLYLNMARSALAGQITWVGASVIANAKRSDHRCMAICVREAVQHFSGHGRARHSPCMTQGCPARVASAAPMIPAVFAVHEGLKSMFSAISSR